MITVKVTYTVKPEFAKANQQNVSAFINDLKKLNNPGLRYEVFLKPDGKTFVHFAAYDSEKIQSEFLALESFKTFQQKRDESGLEAEPIIEQLSYVAAARQMLN